MKLKLASVLFLIMFVWIGAANAGIDGMYLRVSGKFKSTLEVYNCNGGKGLKVVRSTHKPSIGKHVICGAKKKGNKWHGKVHDLENNKSYTGYISSKGNDLNITGCFLGICRSQTLKRAK